MRPLYWKLGLTAMVGAVSGVVAGQATIAGMAPPVAATTGGIGGGDYGAVSYAASSVPRPNYDGIASACDGCSDYDLGYRFAAARHVRESADCMDFNWSYQRGCLAYLREE